MLRQVYVEPGGAERRAHGSNMPSSINDKEMFVEVRSILNQTRASTRAFSTRAPSPEDQRPPLIAKGR